MRTTAARLGWVAAAVVALVIVGAAAPSRRADSAAPAPRTASARASLPLWRLVASDEFGAHALNTRQWRAYNNTYGDANHELACLSPRNVTEGGGSVKIRANRRTVRCPNGSLRHYTSGFIGSREAGRYYPLETRISVRAKVPHAQGLWPAAWLRHRYGAATAEVDVMEYFHAAKPGTVTQTLHLAGRGVAAQGDTPIEGPTPTPGWHTFTVEITRVDADGEGVRDDLNFQFFVDDAPTVAYVDTKAAWASTTDPNATWDVALNLAVGGDWVGNPDGPLGVLENLGRCAQSGRPPSCATTGIRRVSWGDPKQATYELDYLHVFALKH